MPNKDIISVWVWARPFSCSVYEVVLQEHTETVTMDSQIYVSTAEKVKHIAYLRIAKSVIRHKVGTHVSHAITVLRFSHYPYLLWHSEKETKHPANTYSVRELFQFSSKAESSKPPHHSVGSSGRDACLRTLTECNSWTNKGTKYYKMDTQQGQPRFHGWEAGSAHLSLVQKWKRCPQYLSGLSAVRGGELEASATSG